MAARAMREHHHLWHLARNPSVNPAQLAPWEKAELSKPEWKAPRKQGQAGAGIDFLGMHREMIKTVDAILAGAANASWPRVVGWEPIPFVASDANWPVPPSWPQMPAYFKTPKSAASATQQRKNVTNGYRNDNYLRSIGVDQLGATIEGNIHNWMHLRWSAQPTTAAESEAPSNDFLGAPWSSHVNPVFWKLHGWIDTCIKTWEAANHAHANLASAWSGPSHHDHMHVLEHMDHGPAGGAAARIPTIKGINWFRLSKNLDVGLVKSNAKSSSKPKAKNKKKAGQK